MPGSTLRGHDHRGHRRLGPAVEVHGSVQQLSGGDALRDQTQKGQFHITRAQHRPGLGVLKARRGQVERIVGRKERPYLALQLFM